MSRIFVIMSASSFVDLFCMLLLIVVMAAPLTHRLVWPFIKRPIYAANRKQLIKNSKLLGTLGAMALLYAFKGNPVLRRILDFLPKVRA